jgi:biotin-(acetyl-CoA carboxylase) ligase
MPLESARSRMQTAPDLVLPPPFTLVRLRELGDAFVHAQSIAEKQGAGTLVYVGRFDLVEFALVLEPDEPLRQARRAFYAGMTALAEAIAAHAAPETAVAIDWPDTLNVNRGLVGGGRLAWPQGTNEDEPPPWLVFGGMIRTVSLSDAEPGLNPLITALEEEGFGENSSDLLVESFARNIMFILDSWHESGFGAVAKSYLDRLSRESGLRHDIDDNGDLLVRRTGKTGAERQALLPRLAAPAWYDVSAKGPRA